MLKIIDTSENPPGSTQQDLNKPLKSLKLRHPSILPKKHGYTMDNKTSLIFSRVPVKSPAIDGSNTLIDSNDQVFIKEIWKSPLPTNHEVFLFLQTLKDDNPLKIAYTIMLVTGARPVEVIRIAWNKFTYDAEKSIFELLYHYTYKASNRKTKTGSRYYFKEVRKEIGSKSKWLNELLHKYKAECCTYPHEKLFPWATTDGLHKHFSKIRKKCQEGILPDEYNFLVDKITKQIKGDASKTNYRFSLYGLRRFAITFLYWSRAPVGFNQDIVALSKYIGHSNPRTTYEHYVFPKEAIGLTQDMIDKKISIDLFVNMLGIFQSQLQDYTPKAKFKLVPKGQSRLSDF